MDICGDACDFKAIDAKTYRPLSAYGKHDRNYWDLWTDVLHWKIHGTWR